MPAPERIDEVFLALGRFIRLRDRGIHTSFRSPEGEVETAAYRGLFVLKHGPMRASELAAAMAADPSTTSRHVAKLVSEGFVRREPDPADGRAFRLILTDEGHVRVRELGARRRQVVGEMVADWSDEEFDTFSALLTRFVDAVEDRIDPCSEKGDAR
ncbi:MarR family transcriptional regulator [Gordonia malaquae]|jgi:DNA-binding MarR family transcriptional regulator|uniref:MarR family winged helix-turn-helix transcriptional regulator n=1 Tax=Gordonia TaxID=2053 RepID=UPI003017646F